jgi:hypothetical protein
MKKLALAFAIFGAIFVFGSSESVNAQTMTWRGTVDDVVEVTIRGRRADTVTVSGRQYRDGNARFSGRDRRGGRNRDVGRARVRKEDGRGRVRVIQQPSRRNNYTTIIRIEDPKSGADRYRFTVEWD